MEPYWKFPTTRCKRKSNERNYVYVYNCPSKCGVVEIITFIANIYWALAIAYTFGTNQNGFAYKLSCITLPIIICYFISQYRLSIICRTSANTKSMQCNTTVRQFLKYHTLWSIVNPINDPLELLCYTNHVTFGLYYLTQHKCLQFAQYLEQMFIITDEFHNNIFNVSKYNYHQSWYTWSGLKQRFVGYIRAIAINRSKFNTKDDVEIMTKLNQRVANYYAMLKFLFNYFVMTAETRWLSYGGDTLHFEADKHDARRGCIENRLIEYLQTELDNNIYGFQANPSSKINVNDKNPNNDDESEPFVVVNHTPYSNPYDEFSAQFFITTDFSFELRLLDKIYRYLVLEYVYITVLCIIHGLLMFYSLQMNKIDIQTQFELSQYDINCNNYNSKNDSVISLACRMAINSNLSSRLYNQASNWNMYCLQCMAMFADLIFHYSVIFICLLLVCWFHTYHARTYVHNLRNTMQYIYPRGVEYCLNECTRATIKDTYKQLTRYWIQDWFLRDGVETFIRDNTFLIATNDQFAKIIENCGYGYICNDIIQIIVDYCVCFDAEYIKNQVKQRLP